jgi:hypothetical protein
MPLEPLTFSFNQTPPGEHVKLFPVPVVSITDEMWQEFAQHTIEESGLRPTPARVLAERWRQGCAGIVVRNNLIISYTSFTKICCQANRSKFSNALGVSPARLPSMDVYKLTTAWTRPAWRRRGIHLQLTPALQGQCGTSRCLYFAVAVGLAGSPMLEKLGWRIVGWSEIAYASSLIGMPISGFEDRVEERWWPPPDMVRYEGEHISPYEDNSHKWNRFCHLWVSSVPIAVELNDQLSTLMNGDLHRWREACINVFTGGKKSQLNFFNE